VSIMLIRPPYVQTSCDQQFQEPLNLCYLTAVLRREGFDVTLVDAEFCDLTAEKILQRIADDSPALIGISLMSDGGLAGTLRIVEGIRQWAAPQAHVTVGGHFVTFNTEHLLRLSPGIDSAVLYEGENVIADLASRVLSRKGDWRETLGIVFVTNGDGAALHRTEKAPPITNLDLLPFPARDFLPKAIQLGLSPAILSSRGCSGRCSFCTIHDFVRQASGRPWRGRSPQNVLKEIMALVDNFHVGEIGFLDDDFIGTRTEGRQRAMAFADMLMRSGLDVIYNFECRPDMVDRDLFARLRDSGLRYVFLGVEAIGETALKAFNKGTTRQTACRALDILTEVGVEADVGFILYHPYATMDEVWEGYQFLKQYGQCDVHTALNRLFVVPGAPIRQRLQEAGRLMVTSGQTCLQAEDYDYADRRVGVLHAILQVAILPLFADWYNAIKEFRRLAAQRKFDPQPHQTDQRLAQLRDCIKGVDRVVERSFEEAFSYAMGSERSGLDMLQFSRRLRDQASDDVRLSAKSEVCDTCLTQREEDRRP